MTSLSGTDKITHRLSKTNGDRLSDTANRWPDRQPAMTDSIRADRQMDGQAQGQGMTDRQSTNMLYHFLRQTGIPALYV